MKVKRVAGNLGKVTLANGQSFFISLKTGKIPTALQRVHNYVNAKTKAGKE